MEILFRRPESKTVRTEICSKNLLIGRRKADKVTVCPSDRMCRWIG
ncbi:Hypothetical Protein RSKD131_3017 [Cereibacter sphaeroides KD131]|nr:Hypothetical Protein RSKD131_3017 [Cereibacter sphaeroides KD131]